MKKRAQVYKNNHYHKVQRLFELIRQPFLSFKCHNFLKIILNFSGMGETVLIVEDDPGILKLAELILNGLGYMVLTSTTPGGALSVAAKHSGEIQLLITDVIMPDMNGLELAERLQSLYPKLKRIFMSGYTADVIARHGVLDGKVNFIQKPFSKRDFSKTVRKVLDCI